LLDQEVLGRRYDDQLILLELAGTINQHLYNFLIFSDVIFTSTYPNYMQVLRYNLKDTNRRHVHNF